MEDSSGSLGTKEDAGPRAAQVQGLPGGPQARSRARRDGGPQTTPDGHQLHFHAPWLPVSFSSLSQTRTQPPCCGTPSTCISVQTTAPSGWGWAAASAGPWPGRVGAERAHGPSHVEGALTLKEPQVTFLSPTWVSIEAQPPPHKSLSLEARWWGVLP